MRSVRRARVLVAGDRSGHTLVQADGQHGDDVMVELGSLTKTMTAAAISVLAADGLLQLDVPLDEIIDCAPGTGVTVRHLVEHCAGLPRLGPGVKLRGGDPYSAYSADVLTGVLHNLTQIVTTTPGSRFEYSNVGYAILGRFISHIAGEAWYPAVRRLVLDPARIRDIVLRPECERALIGANVLGRARRPWEMAAMAPAGGLWGTPSAAAEWVRVAVLQEQFGPPSPAWCRTGALVWHNGATRDASVLAAAIPDTGQLVVAHAIGWPHDETDRYGLQALAARASGPVDP